MADKNGVFYHPETGEILNGLVRSLLSHDGRLEYPDPIPVAPPVTMRDPARGMRELVQQLIRQEMSQLAEMTEMETFEEADDFDIEDDPLDPQTAYEKVFDPLDSAKAPAAAPQASADAGGSRAPQDATPPATPTSEAPKPAEGPSARPAPRSSSSGT